jgi:hypothetical protein
MYRQVVTSASWPPDRGELLFRLHLTAQAMRESSELAGPDPELAIEAELARPRPLDPALEVEYELHEQFDTSDHEAA